MRVVAFNGSPRKQGNTAILLRRVLEVLEGKGIETEVVQVGGEEIRGCNGCAGCRKLANGRCSRNDDIVNACIEKMVGADGILLGSPTYFTDVTAEMKALVDRAGYVAKGNQDLFRRKVGAGVVAVRRAGSTHALDTFNHFFTINQMIIPGSSYWNLGIGREPGDVEKDEEGLRTMRVLGENMAWLLERIAGGGRG
jgi:multimeric flavodoxin WrbA